MTAVSTIWRHFSHRWPVLNAVANADGTPLCAHTATAAVIFNKPEKEVTPRDREGVQRLLAMEAYSRHGR